MKPPSTLFTIVLLITLIVPYWLKRTGEEPFPAIILPSGHGQTAIDNTTINSSTRKIVVYNGKDSVETNTAKLFPGVPGYYCTRIVNKSFGLPQKTLKEKDKKSYKNYIMPWRMNKYKYQKELQEYYEDNLGMNIDSITVKITPITRDFETGIEIVEEENMRRETTVFKQYD